MRKFALHCVALGVLLVSVAGQAAHITDRLLAGLYAEPSTEQKPLKLLPSGTPVEVLERKPGFQRVRLGDGAEGWVEVDYVTEEKPAKAMLLEAQARIAELEAQLAAAGDGGRCAEVAPASGADCSTANAALEDLQGRVRAAAELLGVASGSAAARPGGAEPPDAWRNWPWYVLPVSLVLGFVGGAMFVDARNRRRHGGFRV